MKSIQSSHLRRTASPALVAILLAVLVPVAAFAALPLKAIRKYQDAAPEKTIIEIVDVKETHARRGQSHVIDFIVQAKVVKAVRSKAGLKPGDILDIRYTIPNFEKSPQPGDWPSGVKKGATYTAYLQVKDPNQKLCAPAAHSGSFEKVKPDKKAAK